MIHIYVKTHNKTGLKYLGKTTNKNPHEYRGSGKYWKRHIKAHGYDVTTEILFSSEVKEEIVKMGIYYSVLWNVVESDQWANLRLETGDGVSSHEATIENNRRLKSGIHPFCDPDFNRKTKDKRNETIRKNGTHNFSSGDIQRQAYKKRLENGTQKQLNEKISIRVRKQVDEGKHPMQQGLVNVVDMHGNLCRVKKEEYMSREDLVHVNSKEGRRRLGKSCVPTEKQIAYWESKRKK